MRIGSVFANGFCKIADDGSVRVEQVVTGHARLSRHAGRDNDHLRTLQSISELIGRIANDLNKIMRMMVVFFSSLPT